jgi:acetoin utilization deacetylase AcuC-like enzyme
MRVGYCFDPSFLEHDPGTGHPEGPRRLEAVNRGLREAGLLDALRPIEARPASRDELLRVHSAAHVDRVAATAGRHVQLDPDTATGPRSYEAATRAAGAVIAAVEAVVDGAVDRAFCAVRPPGHHATRDAAMGFCLFNNVACGAAAALAKGLGRVAIIDFDVHHGNGTQDVFWTDRRVLYVSSHQFPLYPGTGDLQEQGGGDGEGFTVNLPMPAGCGDAEYAAVYREVVLPVVRAFDPQLVLLSAGFDAAAGDPLAGMRVSPTGFRAIVDACVAAAQGVAAGHVVAALEGGYSDAGLAYGTQALVERFGANDAAVRPEAVAASGDDATVADLVSTFHRVHSPRWPFTPRTAF